MTRETDTGPDEAEEESIPSADADETAEPSPADEGAGGSDGDTDSADPDGDDYPVGQSPGVDAGQSRGTESVRGAASVPTDAADGVDEPTCPSRSRAATTRFCRTSITRRPFSTANST